jgi:hypothetical protein
MSVEILNGLLRDFGKGIGLPDLAPDSDGFCRLRIGEKITVSMQHEPQSDDLVLFTTLVRIAPTERAEAYEMMLSANLFWAGTGGGTLAVEQQDGMAMLLARRSLLALDLPAFETLLESFVQAGETWLRRLDPFAAAADEPADGVPAPSGYVILA